VRLARALVRMYATRFRDFELKGATDILEPYVYSQLAAGDAQGALDRVSLSLGSLDTAERSVKSQRVRLLLARGDVMAVMGDASQALASYRQAFALEPEPNASPAECFAALHLARARASKGDTQGALHWIDEAEKAAGQPGKFERLRRAVQGG
jgi:tetratricopeptide (TPR) repeat protein